MFPRREGLAVSSGVDRERRVRLHPHGLELSPRTESEEARVLPLWCGTMHYWRNSPDEWGAALDGIVSMGMRLVDTYVPWGVHETASGSFDFGAIDPRLDVARFLRMAHERGLYVVMRPGPHINAELTYFGLPERIVWDRDCQARTPRDNPVVMPMLPTSFPVPSYASDAFHEETAKWFAAVGNVLRDLRYPDGPIVMVQIDNEGALYFRDGPYDQDYHPDALRLFREFLRTQYSSQRDLRSAWNMPEIGFDTAMPPLRFDARVAEDLPRHMDWMEFHEHLLTSAMRRFSSALDLAGLGELPTMHNFPLGEAATPLNAARMGEVLDLIGLDYYHRATPLDHVIIERRTSELASRCEGVHAPAFGAEMGAGFPPFFPPLDRKDSLYTLMSGLAYGLRGYNLYMAVERDRWVGAPLDSHGKRRPLAQDYEALNHALAKVEFHTLHRAAPVRLVVPRSLRRLARATHAFGPLTPAFFNVIGASFRDSCIEEQFGLGEVATIEGEDYLRAFERALAARGVPFAYAGGDSLDVNLEKAQWIVCTTAGGVKKEFIATLRRVAAAGARVTIGPRIPARDGAMRLLPAPYDTTGIDVEPLDDIARADVLVARRIEELSLPAYPVDPDDIYVSVHEDSKGPRVVFVMNPTEATVVAKVALPASVTVLTDLIDTSHRAISRSAPPSSRDQKIARHGGGFSIELPSRTVRMFAVN
jgi:beta-galactosidase